MIDALLYSMVALGMLTILLNVIDNGKNLIKLSEKKITRKKKEV